MTKKNILNQIYLASLISYTIGITHRQLIHLTLSVFFTPKFTPMDCSPLKKQESVLCSDPLDGEREVCVNTVCVL